MAAFQVKTKDAKKQQEEINKAAWELNCLAVEINAVKAALSFQGAYRANIVSNLGKIAGSCIESGQKMRAMGDVLGQTLDKYEKTETRIVDRLTGSVHIESSSLNGHTDASASVSPGWYQDGKFNPHAKAEAEAAATWKGGKIEGEYKDIKGQASGMLGYASIGVEAAVNLMDDGHFGPNSKVEMNMEVAAAKGDVKIEGKYGSAVLTGAVLSAGAHAGIVFATTDEDGRFSPSLKAEAEAKASVLSGQAERKVGTDGFNAHGEASGALLGAEAKAGIEVSENTIKAEAGAEAYLAKGEVKGGYTILGIEVDLKLEGKAGAVGVKAEFEATDTSVMFGAGLSAVLGAGAEISIDWSGFKLPDFGSLW